MRGTEFSASAGAKPMVAIVQQELLQMQSEKGKAIAMQIWTGPEGSRRLRLPDFMTIGT
jgi:hypothetical protein